MRVIILINFVAILFSAALEFKPAISYGPFRDGQAPGGTNPTYAELREDLHIIADHWEMIRVYGSRGITEDILSIIKTDELNLNVLLGAWISNESKDTTSFAKSENTSEIKKAIELANRYPSIINAISVGNETQVFWTWNKVDFEIMKEYIIQVKSAVTQPVTTADDFNFWNKPEGAELAEYVDFILVHIHPLWAGVELDKAVNWVSTIYSETDALFPRKQTVIGETGWATQVHNKGEQATLINGVAGEKEQAHYYNEIINWSEENEVTTFFFEVFDENWKGGDHPDEVEKHWGVMNSDRTPKYVLEKPSLFKKLKRIIGL